MPFWQYLITNCPRSENCVCQELPVSRADKMTDVVHMQFAAEVEWYFKETRVKNWHVNNWQPLVKTSAITPSFGSF